VDLSKNHRPERVDQSSLSALIAAILVVAVFDGAEAAKLGFSRSYCLSETLPPIEAISSCTAVLQKFHRNVSVLIRRGAAFAELGEFDYAVGDFSRAINIDQNSTLGFELRGLVSEMQGHYQDSLVDYMKALELGLSNQKVEEAILRVSDTIAAEAASQQAAVSLDVRKSGNDSAAPESSFPPTAETPDSVVGPTTLFEPAVPILKPPTTLANEDRR
jgi:tetratricopeptide (TPR) repeat protein